MKKINAILTILIISLIVSSLTYLIIQNLRVVARTSYNMDVIVWDDKRVGINLNTDAIHFGGMGAGNGANRGVIIDAEEDVIVSILKKGQMATWVSNPNNFYMQKGEQRNITFSLSVPKDTLPGNYTGEAIFIFKKP